MTIARDYSQSRRTASFPEHDVHGELDRPRASLPVAGRPRLSMELMALNPMVTDHYGVYADQDEPQPRPSSDVVDMESELQHWRAHHREFGQHPMLRYSDYEPAVRLGLDAYMRGRGRHIREMQEELQTCYRRTRSASRLDWEDARPVIEMVWRRLFLRYQEYRVAAL